LRASCEYHTRKGENAVSHAAGMTASRPTQARASIAMTGTSAVPNSAEGRRRIHSASPARPTTWSTRL